MPPVIIYHLWSSANCGALCACVWCRRERGRDCCLYVSWWTVIRRDSVDKRTATHQYSGYNLRLSIWKSCVTLTQWRVQLKVGRFFLSKLNDLTLYRNGSIVLTTSSPHFTWVSEEDAGDDEEAESHLSSLTHSMLYEFSCSQMQLHFCGSKCCAFYLLSFLLLSRLSLSSFSQPLFFFSSL